jgi:hypothetical protein
MSSVISTISTILNSVNDPLGIFTSDNYQGVNVGGEHGVFGKTGEKIWNAATDPMKNYVEDFAPEIEIAPVASTVQDTPDIVTKAAGTEASNLRRRKIYSSMTKTSGSGVTEPPVVGLKKILG